MNKEEDLVNAVLGQAQEVDGAKKLTCAQAFELAQRFEAEITRVGHICNQHNVKICKCQLGCFS